MAIFLAAISAAAAVTQAVNYQSQQHDGPDGFPARGSGLDRLIGGIQGNLELEWQPPQTPPPGTPAGATRILLAKYGYNTRWTDSCGQTTFVTAVTYQLTIEFADGSVYVYSLQRQVVESGGSRDLTLSTLDCASSPAEDTWKVRGYFRQVSNGPGFGAPVESSFAAMRAPAGGLVRPDGNLDAFVSGRGQLELRAGASGTIDLRGFSASNPVLTAPIPALLFADSVLVDPGVTLGDLFAFPPVVALGEDLHSMQLQPRRAPAALGRGADLAKVAIFNTGTVPEQVLVTWSDSAGWAPPGGVTRSVAPYQFSSVTIPMFIPLSAPECAEDDLVVSASPFERLGGGTIQLSIFADSDADGDGFENSVDDCPPVFDPTQPDFDHDFEGDVCDVDDGRIQLGVAADDSLAWDPEVGFDSWNCYRGDLAVLRQTGIYSQLPGSNPLARRDCGLPVPSLIDPDPPPATGLAAFYLVTGVSGGVEGDLGLDGAGLVRPNANPCP